MLAIESSNRCLFAASAAVLSGCDAVAAVQWRQKFGVTVLDDLIVGTLTAHTDLAIVQVKRNCARPVNP